MAKGAPPSDVPDLRLLAYQEQKPMLRVIRLPEFEVEPAPVSLDLGYALDRCLRREGWIAFRPNLDAWGIPSPLRGEPFFIANEAGWIPSVDPACVWLTDASSGDGDAATIRLYDGSSREVRETVRLPDGFRLAGEVDNGLVLARLDGLYLWSRKGQPEPVVEGILLIVAASGPRFAVSVGGIDELGIADVADGTLIEVTRPKGARWDFMHGAFSPNGMTLAIGVDYSGVLTEQELDEAFAEVIAGRGKYEGEPHGLALVDLDGAVTLAEGQYDNFANPIWTNDSRWIVFNAPFEPRGLWLTPASEPRLQRLPFQRAAPVPLADVSDILAK